ncbi:MAG TPA: hypothetical protein VJ952_01240 [Opitutales bacterium]|nr:hypothetical protein [Opitutales bacterium]
MSFYRQVKSRAALRRRKIKDYVAEGLRLALEADYANDSTESSGPLGVFGEVRRDPLHQPEEVRKWMDVAHKERKSDWRGEP